MKPSHLIIHPSCPKRLITALRRAKGENGKGWNFSVLARQLEINKGTIYKLVVYGIEPKEERLRLALFLPRHPRKPKPPTTNHQPPTPLSLHRKWWKKQPPEFKDKIILLEWTKQINPES